MQNVLWYGVFEDILQITCLVEFWACLSKPVAVYENVYTVRGTLHIERIRGSSFFRCEWVMWVWPVQSLECHFFTIFFVTCWPLTDGISYTMGLAIYWIIRRFLSIALFRLEGFFLRRKEKIDPRKGATEKKEKDKRKQNTNNRCFIRIGR